ncbi:MAG: MGH1-like glycoside hydrolase domain-containing protein [Chloroflexota bacterium]
MTEPMETLAQAVGAQGIGNSARNATYHVADDQLAEGSTLGGPKVNAVIKASGAIEKIYSSDIGESVFGTVILRHFDPNTGMHLEHANVGLFGMHAEHQVHWYRLTNNVRAREVIFVTSTKAPGDAQVDVPAVYLWVELTNDGSQAAEVETYTFTVLRGTTSPDVQASYDVKLKAILAWNQSQPDHVRIFGCSEEPESYETTLDFAKAVSDTSPGPLSNTAHDFSDPLAVFRLVHKMAPGESKNFHFRFSFGPDRQRAIKNFRSSGDAVKAFADTKKYYGEMLGRSVVMTPDPFVNRGVLWAKANMLRVETKSPTGWAFTNDPTRSNNSVARDTAWFGFGADYLTPEFVRDSLLAYVHLQEANGMIVEYYDIRNNQTADYGLNINDDTPLIILALWHHYSMTGDREFLDKVYPCACKAANYILSQRNKEGLVWSTATGVSDWGIVGWRNVIPNYRLSGATTELNSESYAALLTMSQMARELEKHDQSATFAVEAEKLKDAINFYLRDQENGLYYLNIDVEGHTRSNITSDLVFPVIFGVADDRTSAHIVGRLSSADFWTPAGIHTTPRDAPEYTPAGDWGLRGGIWVGVSFWYAFAAAKYSPEFMAFALSSTFRNYSTDPRRTNTVPGEFSEWLNGETLVNMGMMLSPWFPPRYLWAAIEGMAGFDFRSGTVTVRPNLAPEWKWLAVQNMPFRDKSLTWFAVRQPDSEPELQIYTNFLFPGVENPYVAYEQDITDSISVTGDAICAIGLQEKNNIILMIGNTDDHAVSTAVSIDCSLAGSYKLRTLNSLIGHWTEHSDLVSGHELQRGLTLALQRKGFWVLDIRQQV